MQRRRVVVADRRGDAALRVAGVALRGVRFRQDDDAAGRRESDRGAQARDPAADDDENLTGRTRMLSYHPHLHGPRSASTSPRRRATTRSRSATGRSTALGRLLDDLRCRSAASSCRARWSGGSTARAGARALGGAEPILVPDGERFKQLPTVARIYDAWSARTPTARRRSSPSAAASSATWPASRRRPTCAASRSSTCRRRCSRRWTARSAARSA